MQKSVLTEPWSCICCICCACNSSFTTVHAKALCSFVPWWWHNWLGMRRGKPRKNSFWIGMFIPWSQVSEHWGIVQTYPWFYQQSRGNCLDSAAWLSKHSGLMASHGTTSFHLQELLIDLGMETVMGSQVPQKVPKHMDGSWRASMRQLTQLTMYITSYTDISWYIDIYRVYPNQWTLCRVPFHTLVGPHPKNCRKVVGKAMAKPTEDRLVVIQSSEWGPLGKLWQTLHKACCPFSSALMSLFLSEGMKLGSSTS